MDHAFPSSSPSFHSGDAFGQAPHGPAAFNAAQQHHQPSQPYHAMTSYSYASPIPRTANASVSEPVLHLPMDMDAPLPSEYELISRSPEDRAVMLELLRERRRVKELELRILEEKRREREAGAATAASAMPLGTGPDGRPIWDGPATFGIGLSALGARSLRQTSGSAGDYVQHQPQTHHAFPPTPFSTQQHGQHLYNSVTNGGGGPSSSASFRNFDSIPAGLGLSPASEHTAGRDAQSHVGVQSKPSPDSYGSVPHASLPTGVPPTNVIGSPDSIHHSSSPGSAAGQQTSYGTTPYTSSVTLGGWDRSPGSGTTSNALASSHVADQTRQSPHSSLPPASGISSNYPGLHDSIPSATNLFASPPRQVTGEFPLHVYEDTNRQQTYAGLPPGGSRFEEPSPPPAHFYPTPPHQHISEAQLQSASGSFQHHPSSVKHARLAVSTSGGLQNVSYPSSSHGHVQQPPTTDPPSSATTTPPSAVSPSAGGGSSSSAASRKLKKLLFERQITCQSCNTAMCKLLLRGTADELGVGYDPFYQCAKCVPPVPPAASTSAGASSSGTGNYGIGNSASGYGSGSGGFTGSGLRMSRKRTRQTEDTSLPTVCDVCIRTIGRGGLVPRIRDHPLSFAVEVICTKCSGKYSRCSDCGGGSGRVGVGKWRAKELFEPGRKTCRLPHVRLGGGELELSVWEVPWELQGMKDADTMMNAVKTLWTERVLARLAIPEVLEGEEDDSAWHAATAASGSGSASNQPVERSYKDVEDVIAKGWPGLCFSA